MSATANRSHWRRRAREVIDGVIARVGTSDPAVLRREVEAAYPFPDRLQHPLRCWREEVRRRLVDAAAPPPAPAEQLSLLEVP